ncbi:pentapeptide repeat-containing protein [Streptomyces sp. NPDC101221]|uniref:pentapeptide repeat-containing protein n=1 Tax=Streptomyces sp. NPDC101221 TaxID=3366132 RepID=UPI0037FFF3A3
MTAHLPRHRTERRGLRLWPVGTVLALTFTTAVLVAAAVFYTGWDLLGARGLKPERRLDSTTLFDLVKLSFGVVAGAGALVALVVAYRRQRVDEDGALREDTRLHTERFTTAVTQLGDASPAVRLGGVHALAGLADDAPTRGLRQTCIDVLCAYLRLPYTAESDLPADDAEARHAYRALREVRHTVIRLIRDHLRLPSEHPHSWQGHDFDLTEVTFDGGDFTGAQFRGGTVTFTNARFAGGTVTFADARFLWDSRVTFAGAQFCGSRVTFAGAEFSWGSRVTFGSARFSEGTITFARAQFSDGRVDLGRAQFCGSRVTFANAEFAGATINFRDAEFSEGRVTFHSTQFSGGTVIFTSAKFLGSTVAFSHTPFSGGTVDFTGARFSNGRVEFPGAQFSGGTVNFNRARFADGTVDFRDAWFPSGTVDFTGADGVAPTGLVPSSASPFPTGLTLPSTWYPAPS